MFLRSICSRYKLLNICRMNRIISLIIQPEYKQERSSSNSCHRYKPAIDGNMLLLVYLLTDFAPYLVFCFLGSGTFLSFEGSGTTVRSFVQYFLFLLSSFDCSVIIMGKTNLLLTFMEKNYLFSNKRRNLTIALPIRFMDECTVIPNISATSSHVSSLI